jgi:hypothetical protein
MNREVTMNLHVLSLVSLALLVGPIRASGAGAQAPVPAPGSAESKPTPRAVDGHPDLNGIWGNRGGGLPNTVQKGNTQIVVFQLEGADIFQGTDLFAALDRRGVERKANAPNKPPYKPELRAKLEETSRRQTRLDPAFYCKPQGVPRMGPPDQIAQTPGQVVFLYANRNTFRVIPTGGRGHRDDVDPSWMGDSVGRWEGDTLVVDVRHFTDESWLDADGWFHSDQMRVTERFRRDGDVLHYSVTVEDPGVFTGPWEMTPRRLTLLTGRSDGLMESPPCIERSSPHMVTDDHH